MGAAESSLIDDKLFGFRVYKIAEGGPLHSAGVRELEDFLIPAQEVFNSKIPFYEYVKKNSSKKIDLNIYSLLKRHFYTIQIIPNLEWSPNRDQGHLGASVRYENWSTADRCLLRVVKVREFSPADKKLGLVAGEDFIIALRPENEDILTLNKDFTDPLTIFTNYLSLYINKNVEFFIYNCNKGSRHVTILLEEEVLGCDVAYGKLHEFPRLKTISEKEQGDGGKTKIVNLDVENKLKEDTSDKEINQKQYQAINNKTIHEEEIEKISQEIQTKFKLSDLENSSSEDEKSTEKLNETSNLDNVKLFIQDETKTYNKNNNNQNDIFS
jgi:hypothetical protein